MREPEVSMTTSVRLWVGVSGLAAMAAVSVMVLAPVSPVLSSAPDARPTTTAPLGDREVAGYCGRIADALAVR